MLSEAKWHGVRLSEFQLDFDCAQQKLAGYRLWLGALRPMVRPVRFVITTLGRPPPQDGLQGSRQDQKMVKDESQGMNTLVAVF